MIDYKVSIQSITDISLDAIRHNSIQRISHLTQEESDRIYSDLKRGGGKSLKQKRNYVFMVIRKYASGKNTKGQRSSPLARYLL